MKLVDVYADRRSASLLFRLLEERQPVHNISHGKMPSYDRHLQFFHSRPYAAWYLIQFDADLGRPQPETAGAIYLTRPAGRARAGDEIGIQLFKEFHGRGIGSAAIRALMDAHPRPEYFANINPTNERSIRMFGKLGFKLKQVTYSLEGGFGAKAVRGDARQVQERGDVGQGGEI